MEAGSAARARLKSPNRRIERSGLFSQNRKREFSSRAGRFVPYGATRVAGESFYDFPIVDPFEPDETVAANGHPPLNRTTNVGAQQITVELHDCVRDRRDGKTSERGPHHGRGRNVSARERSVRRTQGISDKHRRACAEPAAQEEIKSGAIRCGHAHRTISPCGEIAFLIIPPERDLSVASWDLQFRQRPVRRENSGQRRCRRNAGDSSEREEADQRFHFVSMRVMRSPCTMRSSTS